MRGAAILGGLMLAFAALPALAQADDEIIRATAGRYRISDGTHSCTVTLKAEGSIGGHEADLGKGCEKIDPKLADIGVWNLDGGGIVFSDTLRHRIVSFDENEGGPYTAARPHGRPWTLSALGGAPALTPAQQMRGRWNVVVDQKTVCGYALTSNAKGTAGTIAAQPGCEKSWAGRGLTRWRLQGDRLLMGGADGRPAMTLRRTEVITFSGLLYGNVHIDLMKDVP